MKWAPTTSLLLAAVLGSQTAAFAVDRQDVRPLIIDQPEENLDPNSVFKELVPHFREARERRQVIIVTHNANLVVNTDLVKSLNDATVKAKLLEIGGEPNPGAPDQFGNFIHSETLKWAKIIKEANIPLLD